MLCGTKYTQWDMIKISTYPTVKDIQEKQINTPYSQMTPRNIFQVEKKICLQRTKCVSFYLQINKTL